MNSRFATTAAILLITVLYGCSASEDGDSAQGLVTGPTMQPGADCFRCHAEPTDYREAPRWTLAGTVFPTARSGVDEGVEGARVVVTEPSGAEVVTLVTNSVGNFYTAVPLPEGYRVAVEYAGESISMPCSPPSGGCAACHSTPPIGHAPGRIHVPQGASGVQGGFDCEAWEPKDP
jgi:hypothetical protein